MMRGDDMAVVSRHNYVGRSIVLCQRKKRITCEVRRSMGGIVKVDLDICWEIDRYTCMYVLEENKARGEG